MNKDRVSRGFFAAEELSRPTPRRASMPWRLILTASLTAASLLIEPIAGHTAVASCYLLLVIVTGLKFRRGAVLLVAASSAFAWYAVFIPPRLAFHIGTIEDTTIFASFFPVAMAMGHLTSQLRLKEIAERNRERRTAALYELLRQAGLAADLDYGLGAAIDLIKTFFGVRAALRLRARDGELGSEPHAASSLPLDAREYAAALEAFGGSAPIDHSSAILPASQAMHLPLRGSAPVMGVLSIQPASGTVIDADQREMLEAFAMLMATIVEKDELLQVAEHGEIVGALGTFATSAAAKRFP